MLRPLAPLLLLACLARADVLVTSLGNRDPVRGISLTVDKGTVTVHSAQGPVVKLQTAQVVGITTVPAPHPPRVRPQTFEVRLTCGSRLRGRLTRSEEDRLTILTSLVWENRDKLDLDIENVRSLIRVDGTAMPGASQLVHVAGSDFVYDLDGARVTGVVAAFSASDVLVDRRKAKGDRRIPYARLAAIFLDTKDLPAPAGLHVVARLVDGSVLVLEKFKVQGGRLEGRTACGLEVSAAAAHVVALSFQGGSFVHLSDVKPVAVKRTPFFPLPDGPGKNAMLEFVCPIRIDLSPDGNPITLRKQTYFKGFGVRPYTELTFPLGGQYSAFESWCGIDDEVLGPGYGHGAGTGSVVFLVKVDGKEVLNSAPIEGGRKPVRVHVSLAGAQTLTLIVAPVPQSKMPKGQADSPELDNAVWARPLLIK